ncbi:HAD family hydrolase [Anoxybacteroides tepidamans]|uniref:HAD family hydrolase n=1 Tax=Anoxybacteroides tepidamans TaxID=265948 RepID=UPI0004885687|nr:HAD family hydrolase [Anoxybacillus tepidamans]
MTGIKVIVFDLDGTLYEDTHHFDYYAERIEKRLDKEKQALFRHDYETVLSGAHPLKIGTIYDVKHDAILTVDRNDMVVAVYNWDGTAWPVERVKQQYAKRVTVDLDMMLSIGDLWWVPKAIGSHYGLTDQDTYAAFLETRAFMMSPHFTMKRIAGLAELLQKLGRTIALVLMTNSPEPDSEAILEKLGLAKLFHQKIFRARKPIDTVKHLKTIAEQFHASYEEMISVGDNWRNDIAPAKQLGCQTIYIDPHQIGTDGSADVVVGRITDCLNVLRNLLPDN